MNTSTVLLLAFLAMPDNHCSPRQARAVVNEAVEAGRRYEVKPSVILAVVMAETKCRNAVSRRRFNGGRDVGYAQIHVRRPTKKLVARMLDVRRNLMRSAKILSWSRLVCNGRGRRWSGCQRTKWALYNYRSRTWWIHVKKYLRQLESNVRRRHLQEPRS